ncbi:MAG: DMT family transporter [Methanomassiliicoccus sp.]|nr:DMT family transporter [Methanomassiliicoccus sp.]
MAVAIASISFASIFIRWSDAPPVVIAAYRMLFASLMLLPFALRERYREEVRWLDRRQWWAVVIIGAVLGLHFLAFNAALQETSIASATVLVTAHPIVVGVLGYIYLKERPRRSGLGIALGLLGVVVISSSDLSGGAILGDLLALVGMLAAALYLLGGRVLRQRISVVPYAFLVYSIAAAVLFATALATGASLWPYPVEEWIIFLALAAVSTILGHTILNWSLRYLPAAFISLSMLGEPVGASILAYLLLSEVPSAGVVVGGSMVLAGILLSAGGASAAPTAGTTPGQ